VRRFTFITLIVLFTLIVVAAVFQLLAALKGSGRFCGPGQTSGCVTRSPLPSPSGSPSP
jgi:hypothetical protein